MESEKNIEPVKSDYLPIKNDNIEQGVLLIGPNNPIFKDQKSSNTLGFVFGPDGVLVPASHIPLGARYDPTGVYNNNKPEPHQHPESEYFNKNLLNRK